jgi:hypothetical protein
MRLDLLKKFEITVKEEESSLANGTLGENDKVKFVRIETNGDVR